MSVNLIFKIAAVGILVSVLGRTAPGFILDPSLYFRSV